MNQITIIGLGQIGTSLGLALAEYQDEIRRVGHDKVRSAAKHAQSSGAVDAVPVTLSGAVKDADFVILAVPLSEIQETLELVVRDLKPGALVMDTAPLKRPIESWIAQLLPENCSYVGLVPVLQSDYLESAESGGEAARSDLFEGCLMAVIHSQRSSSEAVNAAANFAGLVGAEPFFAGAAEIDGLMSSIHVLPQIAAAALLQVTQDAPGWRDARKVSGKPYTQVTLPLVPDDVPEGLTAALIHNQDNARRLIDDLIRELVDIRDQITDDHQQQLAEKYLQLQQARDLWWKDRVKNNWKSQGRPSIPKRNMLAELLGIGARQKSPRNED